MILGYVRISSVTQNEARQLETMKKYNVEKLFSEKVSGKDRNRPKLQELLDFCRAGDTIVIKDFSRLARSTKDLLEITDFLKNKKVSIISEKESLDSDTPGGKMMMTMIAAINEFERETLLERQREGIAIAKENGKYKGRKAYEIDDTFKELYEKYKIREITKTKFAEQLKMSRPSLDRLIKEYLESKKS